ncbi:MAG: xanthine dehydrogenase family protein subunit M [Chloroflexi bacterium]|nr:xanthine dehydrogenase family protein subunit M [Chloroflexota bacterium]
MKFDLLEPNSVAEACSMLAQHGEETKAIAGGTALLQFLKQGLLHPTHLVNLSRLRELDGIVYDVDKGLRIGALSTHAALESSPLLRRRFLLLAEVAHRVASPRIRNMATLGGSLCHGDPNQDTPAALMALDAQVRLVGPQGERQVALEDFLVDYYETALAEGEILAQVLVPDVSPDTRWCHIKYTPRSTQDFATVGVVVALRMNERRVEGARIVLNAVAHRVMRARRAEALLLGQSPEDDLLAAAGREAATEVEPLSDIRGSAGYKREMVAVFVQRSLRQALGV